MKAKMLKNKAGEIKQINYLHTIRKYRGKYNLTVKKMSKLLGVHYQTYYNWANCVQPSDYSRMLMRKFIELRFAEKEHEELISYWN